MTESTDDQITLKRGVASYDAWRNWQHTEIEFADGRKHKLIYCDYASLMAAAKGYAHGATLGIPTVIAVNPQDSRIYVWPAPDDDYPVKLPEPYAPASPYAGNYAKQRSDA